MYISCPNCAKKLKLSDKINNSIRDLPPGKTMRLPCPQCKEKIILDTNSLTTGTISEVIPVGAQVKPPAAPDITWLKDGIFEEKEIVEDVPQTLIIMETGVERQAVSKAIESIGYQACFADSAVDAMEKMQFVNYASVVFHSQYEGGDLDNSPFHQFMRSLPMQKRRFIFYILIGPQFSTLYDLEALAYSANLVVNNREIPQLLTILRKAIPEYEEIFGNLMAEISSYTS
jgi:hypothetical protein